MVRVKCAMAASLIVLCSPAMAAKKAPPPPPPITFDRPSSAPAPSERFGDWEVTFGGGSLYIATTSNTAKAAFGSICDDTGCVAFFNPKIDCVEGDGYPALINAPAASYSVSLKCEKIDDFKIYSLPIEGAIADAMSVGGVLGIAFPMASGEFKVSRFSLTGAARASARAAQLATRKSGDDRKNASDNFTL